MWWMLLAGPVACAVVLELRRVRRDAVQERDGPHRYACYVEGQGAPVAMIEVGRDPAADPPPTRPDAPERPPVAPRLHQGA
ncbi:MAG: hypothetical protein JWM75_1245 [Sphingomonas bacterium]|nr:hypothetical protein [Sphingomonas bacterium]